MKEYKVKEQLEELREQIKIWMRNSHIQGKFDAVNSYRSVLDRLEEIIEG